MSFSRSSKGSYRNGNYGSDHYKRGGGLLGNLSNLFGGSGSDRRRGYDHYPQQPPVNYPQQPNVNNPSFNQNTAVCSNCNAGIPAGAAFCMQCGQKVNNALFCISCGEKLPPNAKFCLKCGSKQNG